MEYLREAHAAELGLRRDMQTQIGMTPRGRYRTLLERHLRQTDRHVERLGERLAELGDARGRVELGIGTATTLAAQLLSIGRVPLEFVRGSAGAERVLRNARDSCGAEAHEIATYTALERIARDADDRRTAKLAAWIRADEESMLRKILAEIPALTDAVARGSFEVARPKALTRTTGAGGAVGAVGADGTVDASNPSNGALQHADRAVHQASGEIHRASVAARRRLSAASAQGLPEPWAGYDALTAVEVIAALDGRGAAVLKRARGYERAGKQRSTVIKATERELARS